MISAIRVILTGIILGHDCIAGQIQDQSCIGNTELFKKNRTDPGFFDQFPQHKVIPYLQAATSRIVLFCFRQFSIRKETQKICIRVHPALVLKIDLPDCRSHWNVIMLFRFVFPPVFVVNVIRALKILDVNLARYGGDGDSKIELHFVSPLSGYLRSYFTACQIPIQHKTCDFSKKIKAFPNSRYV